jgi:hypothetical protein
MATFFEAFTTPTKSNLGDSFSLHQLANYYHAFTLFYICNIQSNVKYLTTLKIVLGSNQSMLWLSWEFAELNHYESSGINLTGNEKHTFALSSQFITFHVRHQS